MDGPIIQLRYIVPENLLHIVSVQVFLLHTVWLYSDSLNPLAPSTYHPAIAS